MTMDVIIDGDRDPLLEMDSEERAQVSSGIEDRLFNRVLEVSSAKHGGDLFLSRTGTAWRLGFRREDVLPTKPSHETLQDAIGALLGIEITYVQYVGGVVRMSYITDPALAAKVRHGRGITPR